MSTSPDQRQVKASWYRARAADCESLTKVAPEPRSKAVLEKMAATWIKLAEMAESGQSADPSAIAITWVPVLSADPPLPR
jgi:hypothetical protein